MPVRPRGIAQKHSPGVARALHEGHERVLEGGRRPELLGGGLRPMNVVRSVPLRVQGPFSLRHNTVVTLVGDIEARMRGIEARMRGTDALVGGMVTALFPPRLLEIKLGPCRPARLHRARRSLVARRDLAPLLARQGAPATRPFTASVVVLSCCQVRASPRIAVTRVNGSRPSRARAGVRHTCSRRSWS